MKSVFSRIAIWGLVLSFLLLFASCKNGAPADNSTSNIESSSADIISVSDSEETVLYESFIKKAINDGDFGDGPEAGWFETSNNDEKLYAYYDIDANGVTELLLGEDGLELTGREEKIIQHIYTVSEQKIVRQDFFGFFAETESEAPVIFKNGLVRSGGPSCDGDIHYSYYNWNGDSLTNVCSFQYWPDDESSYTEITADGIKNITEEEYSQSVKNLEGGSERVDIDSLEWRKMTDFLDKNAKRDVVLNADDTVEVMVRGRDKEYRKLSKTDSAFIISVLSSPDGDSFSGFCFDSYSWNPKGTVQFKIGDYLFDFEYSGNSADMAMITDNVRTHGFLDENLSKLFYDIICK